MGLIHTPRTIARIANGLWRGRGQTGSIQGLGPDEPHIYRSRLGVLDVDYLGHLNNAAYLSHAELARWELTATNGMLKSMLTSQTNFIVTGSCVRYRQEISPILRQYQIETFVAGLNERYIYMVQNFRYPGEEERVRAQIVLQAVAKNKKGILNPGNFLVDTVGFPRESVDALTMPRVSDASMENVLERYGDLQDALRDAASADDARERAQ